MPELVTRNVTGVERLFLAADRIHPFINQMLVEGTGFLDRDAWADALRRVVPVWPGACLRLRGILGWSRWTADGTPPRIRVVDASDWDARSEAGAPFLADRLDPKRGPTVEILLLSGLTPRVLFRTHHAVLDGRATILFAQDLFAALEGRPIQGAPGGAPTAVDLARKVALPAFGVSRPPSCPPLLGPPDDAPAGGTWRRVSLAGTFSGFLSRVAVSIVQNAASRDGDLTVVFPVDLRGLHPEAARSSANLTSLVRLDAKRWLSSPKPAEAMAADLQSRLAAREDASTLLGTEFLRWLPIGLLARLGRSSGLRALAAGRFDRFANLSNLGRFDAATLSGGGFRASSWFFIPASSPGVPFTATLSGTGDGAEIVMGTPRCFATKGRLDTLAERVRAAIAE